MSHLFIASQTWYDDLDTFFAHENQATPPSLSENGSLMSPKKTIEILSCLSDDDSLSKEPEIDAKVIANAAIIGMLKSTYGKTFPDYVINTFMPCYSSLLRQVERVDLVWDRYFEENSKNSQEKNVQLGPVERLLVIAFFQ